MSDAKSGNDTHVSLRGGCAFMERERERDRWYKRWCWSHRLKSREPGVTDKNESLYLTTRWHHKFTYGEVRKWKKLCILSHWFIQSQQKVYDFLNLGHNVCVCVCERDRERRRRWGEVVSRLHWLGLTWPFSWGDIKTLVYVSPFSWAGVHS